jgi:hypothetical protein
MPMPQTVGEHPTPAQAFELGVKYATLLRHLYNHPDFKYQEPPTAAVAKLDLEKTPKGLYFTTEFVQTTYVNNVLPYLPQGASRKCKDLANPWAYEDPNYKWEWTWDAEAGALKDAEGNVVEFPRLSTFRAESIAMDLVTRNFLVKKLILEGSSDPKTTAILGGQDFGDEVRAMAEQLE